MKLDRSQHNRMFAFVALVCACTVGIGYENYRIKLREQDSESGKAIRDELEKLVREPFKWSFTAVPGPHIERVMRAEWAHVLPARVDVMVVGMSDADHMSGTSFKEPSHFYNGFVSNSLYAYQWEVLDYVMKYANAPKLVLFDVRAGRVLAQHPEPAYEDPPGDSGWWAGPPLFHGSVARPAWYKDIPSLLSLAQTEFTFRTLVSDFKARRQSVTVGTDDEESYVLLPANKPSVSHRWLSDGTRVYPGEVDGQVVPRGQGAPEEARGVRTVNDPSVVMLDVYLAKLAAAGIKVIVYATPISAAALEDTTQLPTYAEFDRRIREVTERRGVDFCDLTTRGPQIGCTVEDYYDEVHMGRHCNERILHELITGCAPRVGPELRTYVIDGL